MKPPKTAHLLDGQVVKVDRVFYPYAQNVYRISYHARDGTVKGCLAELFPEGWEEIDRNTVRQRHPAPLKPVTEEYDQ